MQVQELKKNLKMHTKDYTENPDDIKVMFYFNDAPIPPSQINTNQLSLINQFREKLGEIGELYWFYNGPDDFSKIVRRHLDLQLPHWQKVIEKETNGTSNAIRQDVESFDEVDKDDEGFFELLEIGEKMPLSRNY